MPENVRATALSTHAIRLTWSIRFPPLDSFEIEVIDGFYIGYRAVAGNGVAQSDTPTSYTYKTISNSPLQQLYNRMSMMMNIQNLNLNTKSNLSSSSTSSKDHLNIHKSKSTSSLVVNNNLNNQQQQYYEHIVDILTRQTQYQ